MTARRLLTVGAAVAAVSVCTARIQATPQPTYDITTLAGKVASLNGTAGLQIRFSSFIEEEAEVEAPPPAPGAPITPTFVLTSPLDATSVAPPQITVNQDVLSAPQNETAIVVDPNRPMRLVAGANDYTTRTWDCTINGTPCSALGDGYSGTYFSNDGGATWCCTNSGPSTWGTLIPGVTRLTGGQYDAGGDPALAFDGQGNVYYAGLGFNRTSPPNTVAVNKGTFDQSGQLHWAAPVFINATTAPSTLNDKEWIAADAHADSPFANRVYVSWTRFIFNPHNGSYVQSPIAFAYSSDGGATFSSPALICGNVLYGQGSRPVVGPDGTVYVFWLGSTRLQSFNSIWMVKSTDGGVNWSQPTAVAQVADVIPMANTAFRVNSYPAADVAANGDLVVAWSSEVRNTATQYGVDRACAYWLSGTTSVYDNCHSQAAFSRSTDGGATWSAPAAIFPSLDGSTQSAQGYPVTQPGGASFPAPTTARRVDTFWPAVAASANGTVYMSAYAATTVSPWQTCATPQAGTAGRINCLVLGDYINNARLAYYVMRAGGGAPAQLSGLINTRYGFGGGFFGDYTALAAGSDGAFHALWTDSNNVQDVHWFFGFEFAAGTRTHQQDVVTRSGSF